LGEKEWGVTILRSIIVLERKSRQEREKEPADEGKGLRSGKRGASEKGRMLWRKVSSGDAGREKTSYLKDTNREYWGIPFCRQSEKKQMRRGREESIQPPGAEMTVGEHSEASTWRGGAIKSDRR